MNIPNYISSGILELYVAGALSDQESIEVTSLVRQHPEIKTIVEDIEQAFICYAALHAPPISANTSSTILFKQSANQKTNSGNIIAMSNSLRRLRGLAAGLAIFLLASLLANLYQNSQLNSTQVALEETEKELLAIVSKEKQLASQFQVQKAEYQTTKQAIATISNTSTKRVLLKAAGNAPKTTDALVYWHKETKAVYVYAVNLPTPPPDKSYQLWSLTDMKPLTPVDAGILKNYTQDKDKVFKVNNVDKAVAFAITLEPKGGSKSPTLEQLQVLGQL